MSRRVCAVVVTYNRKDFLCECLNAIKIQTQPVDEILVVDNASTDGTPEMLAGKFSEVQMLRHTENQGSSGGFCAGSKWAYEQGFDWIWLMDDDVMPEKQALGALLCASSSLPEVGFLCSRVVGIDGLSMNVPLVDDRRGSNLYPQWDALLLRGLVKVRAATFVSLFVHRRAIKSSGFPIRELFIWADDHEFTSRITQSMPAYMVGSSVVVHKRAIQAAPQLLLESDVQRIKNSYFKFRNRLYCTRKHNSRKAFIPFLLYSILTIFRALFTRPYPLLRATAAARGLIAGFFFNPKVEYPIN